MNWGELQHLAEQATEGPWYLVTASDKMKAGIDAADGSAVVWNSDRQWDNEETGIDNEANARFIAAANPTAILALLSELDTLSAKNKALAERVAGLEEGLRPFAAVGAAFGDTTASSSRPVWGYDGITLTWGDFRRARTLITGADQK